MESLQNLLNQIDDIKEKITSQEYKDLTETMMRLKRQQGLEKACAYEIKIVGDKIEAFTCENGIVNIRNEMGIYTFTIVKPADMSEEHFENMVGVGSFKSWGQLGNLCENLAPLVSNLFSPSSRNYDAKTDEDDDWENTVCFDIDYQKFFIHSLKKL